jgi:hypothetical protein
MKTAAFWAEVRVERDRPVVPASKVNWPSSPELVALMERRFPLVGEPSLRMEALMPAPAWLSLETMLERLSVEAMAMVLEYPPSMVLVPAAAVPAMLRFAAAVPLTSLTLRVPVPPEVSVRSRPLPLELMEAVTPRPPAPLMAWMSCPRVSDPVLVTVAVLPAEVVMVNWPEEIPFPPLRSESAVFRPTYWWSRDVPVMLPLAAKVPAMPSSVAVAPREEEMELTPVPPEVSVIWRPVPAELTEATSPVPAELMELMTSERELSAERRTLAEFPALSVRLS